MLFSALGVAKCIFDFQYFRFMIGLLESNSSISREDLYLSFVMSFYFITLDNTF